MDHDERGERLALLPRLHEQHSHQCLAFDRRRADVDKGFQSDPRTRTCDGKFDIQQFARAHRRRPAYRQRLPALRRREASVQKGTTADFNNIYVSRSTDGGETWTANLVYHAPRFTNLANFWPTLAADPEDGTLYTAWTDQYGVWVSSSTDKASHWSPPVEVSAIATTVMPWVAALNGKVDVVYYGSTASSTDDANAVWNTYDSQLQAGVWSVGQVSNAPNRIGPVCLMGSACTANRELLDLFEVAEDPASGKAAVIYTDTTVDTWTSNGTTQELPEIVLAYEQ